MTLPVQDNEHPAQPPESLSVPLARLRTPELDEGIPDQKRKVTGRYFANTFDTYTRLFDCLADDGGYFQKSISLRHPLIFYLGHTATFFVNILVPAKRLPERIDPPMESIFAVGVDEMSWDDLNDDHYTWPSVSDVFAYRANVRARVFELIESLPLNSSTGGSSSSQVSS